jgi:uncharacterized protein YgiB involved in biofilm formation
MLRFTVPGMAGFVLRQALQEGSSLSHAPVPRGHQSRQ